MVEEGEAVEVEAVVEGEAVVEAVVEGEREQRESTWWDTGGHGAGGRTAATRLCAAASPTGVDLLGQRNRTSGRQEPQSLAWRNGRGCAGTVPASSAGTDRWA